MQAAPTDPKYFAFISYSHNDRKWGDWLHKALEIYRVPKPLIGRDGRDGPIPARVFPIFRDREELPTSSALGRNIGEALAQSRYLIVICSPNAAQSQWVGEEVRLFKAMGREDRILCLIVDGEPNATEKPDSALAECFPEAVRYRVDTDGNLTSERTEPIAADARPHADGKDDAKLKLLAGLLGVGFDDLKRRELRRQQRRLVIAASAMTVIAGVMTVLALSAWFGWQRAQQQEALALNARDQAETIATTMLFDFRDKLEPLGRLDLMKDNAVVVRDYYLNLPAEHSSATTERRRGVALMNVGDVLRLQGADKEARVAFNESERIFTKLRETDPDNVEAQRAWTVIAMRIADQHAALGQIKQARRLYEAITVVTQDLLNKDQHSLRYRRDLSVVLVKLGNMFTDSGAHELSEQHLKRALELVRANALVLPDDKQAGVDVGVVLDGLANLYQTRNDKSSALEMMQETIPIDRKLVRDHPEDFLLRQRLAKSLARLGKLHRDVGDLDSARDVQTERWQILNELVVHDPTNNRWARSRANCFSDLARIKYLNGELSAARSDYVEAIGMFQTLVELRPDDLESHFDLAIAHEMLGDSDAGLGSFAEALSSYRNALEIVSWLVANSDGASRWDSANAAYFGKVGDTATWLGQYDEARNALENAVSIMEGMLSKDPQNKAHQRNLSIAVGRLAYLERTTANYEHAGKLYQRAIELDEALLDAAPEDPEAIRDLAISTYQLGANFRAQGDSQAALAPFESSLALRRRLVALAPSTTSWRGDVAESLLGLGDIHSNAGAYPLAREYYSEALELNLQLAAAVNDGPSYERQAAFSHNRIGQSYSLEGNTAAAIEHYEQAFTIVKGLAERDPDNSVWQSDYALSLRVLAQGAALPDERDKAIDYNSRALEILRRLHSTNALQDAFVPWIAEIEADINKLKLTNAP